MRYAGTKTILLVEDEQLIAMAEKTVLEQAGYRVIAASTGTEAIDCALNGRDIDLGCGMDGTEAAEIILRDREIPVVFLSSHSGPETAEKTERISSYGYVLKNSGDTFLLASIRMAFRLHEAHQKTRKDEDHYRCLFETVTQGIVHQAADGAIISVNPAAERILGLTFDQMRGKTSMDHSERDAQDSHQALVNHLPGIIYTFSNKMGSVYCSNQVADILGYDPVEIKANPFIWNHSIHPEDKPAVQDAIESHSKGADYSVEYRIKTKSGRWIWLHGRIVKIIVNGFATDSTERRQAEEALRTSEETLRAVVGFAVCRCCTTSCTGRNRTATDLPRSTENSS